MVVLVIGMRGEKGVSNFVEISLDDSMNWEHAAPRGAGEMLALNLQTKTPMPPKKKTATKKAAVKKAAVKKVAKKATKKVAKKATKKVAKKAAKKVAKKAVKKTTKKAAKKAAKSVVAKAPVSAKVSHEEIAKKAYELYESRIKAGFYGDSQGDWAAAERSLSA